MEMNLKTLLKRTGWLAAILSAFLLTNCDLLGGDDDESTSPQVQGLKLTDVTGGNVTAGSQYALEGTVTDDESIDSISITLAGSPVGVAAGYKGEDSWDFTDGPQTVSIPGSMANGEAKLVVTAWDGDGNSGSATLDLNVSGGTAPVEATTKTLTAGAQDHATEGSSIDLDEPKAYLIGTAASMMGQIDVIYAYSGAASTAAIYTPFAAKNGIGGSAGFSFLENASPVNQTDIREVSGAEISTITSAEMQTLWAGATTDADGRIPVTVGTQLMAETDQGKLVLLHVTDLTGTTAGTATISVRAKFADTM